MPQISKALLSDLMYITNAYLDGLIKESMGISEYRPKTKEWLQNEEAFTKNALNQLRALYEVSDSSFGGPRPPIITGGEDVLK